MKKINVIIGLCIGAATLCGCSDSLLDVNPNMQNTTNNFFKSAEQLEQGVNAAYSTLQLNGQYEISNLLLGELPSDNTWDEVPANDGGYCGQLDEFSMTSGNTVTENSWRDNYIGIQQCNVVLNRVGNVPGLTDDKKNTTIGEMKFLRGLMYFNLVRIFGDVPLVTQETSNVNDYFGQGRTASEEVYKQIVADLTEASSLLPEKESQRGRANKWAALGILAKVELTLKDYQAAQSHLQEIVNANRYMLLDDPAQIFSPHNKGNKEIIFDVQFESGMNGNTEGSDAFRYFSPSGTVNGAKGHNLPTKEVYDLFADNDLRKNTYIKQTTGNLASGKFVQTSDVIEDGGNNVVVLRYADVLLMLSECLANNGQLEEACHYLNLIKRRAGISTFVSNVQSEVLDEIALERRKELVNEGSRWFDLIRTGKAVEVMNNYFKSTIGYNGISITEDNLVQPIPQSQIDTDSSILQNKNYN